MDTGSGFGCHRVGLRSMGFRGSDMASEAVGKGGKAQDGPLLCNE